MQILPVHDPELAETVVTLFVPGLARQAALPQPLERLCTRADRLAAGPEGEAERLFALFGQSSEKGQDLPIAAVTRVSDMGVIDQEWWIRADPVYLETARDNLVLHAGLDLTQEEASALAAELNESLSEDGWLLKAPRPQRWYLKPPAAPVLTTTALALADGRNVRPLLPRGADYKIWHTRLNEIQILLHTSPVNAAREARGLLPANSVWLWGGGRLPQAGAVRWRQVWGNAPLAQGLARLASIPSQTVPSTAMEFLTSLDRGEYLLVLDHLADSLDRVAEEWISPLLAAVHNGRIKTLRLISDAGAQFLYRKTHRWRWWRRSASSAPFDSSVT